jgi:hypothetical protein
VFSDVGRRAVGDGLRYDWSVYQMEFSRNLLFTQSLVALGVLRDHVLASLLSGSVVPPARPPRNARGDINQCYNAL